MAREILIGLIGDRNPTVRAHVAIPMALGLAAQSFGCRINQRWLHTSALGTDLVTRLAQCDGLWCVPGSPYADMDAALRAIEFARTKNRPFLGTCGGFQHALVEYARNALELKNADHLESNADTDFPLITRLSCSLVGAQQSIRFVPGTRAAQLYCGSSAMESFHCNYGLNPQFESLLKPGPLRISGRDSADEVRVIELDSHRFFVATLFQPELKAGHGELHPIIRGFVGACLESGQPRANGNS